MSFWRPTRPHRLSRRFRVFAWVLAVAIWPVAFIALHYMRRAGGDPAFHSDREIVRFLIVGACIWVAAPVSLLALALLGKLVLKCVERPRRSGDSAA